MTYSWHEPTPLHDLPDELKCACVRQSESTKRGNRDKSLDIF